MRFLVLICCLLMLISCQSDTKTYTNVSIETIFSDSLSVRAITPLDENRVWFAANKGIVGLIDGTIPKLATIKYQDSLVNFRAIAKTKEAVFVLSIEDPAILYKIGYDGTEATYIEEVYFETHPKVFYDSIKFWDETEGIAMGDPTDDCLSILITRNKGNSWHKIDCSKLAKVASGEAAFAASNSNIAVYENHAWVVTGGKKARVFHTPDRGINWEVYNTPIIQGKAMTGIYSVDFLNETTGVIFGGNWEDKNFNEGNKALTLDGGKTWRLLANGQGPGYRSSVRFVPNSKGQQLVALGSEGISYSADQGETWQELSTEGFYALEFVNDSIAFASGRNKIAKLIFN